MNTKNISLLGLGLLAAAALASCDHVEESLAKPITNPQEPIFDAASVEYKAFPYIDASDPQVGEVEVAYCVAPTLPAGFTLSGTLELSATEDFSKKIEVPLTYRDHHMYANVGDIAAQYTELYTKNPATVDLYSRTILTAANGTDVVRIGSIDTYFGDEPYAYTPVLPSKLIPANFYLMMGDGSDWDYAHALKMNHAGSNQYDDPNFSIVVKEGVSAGDKWIIVPAETIYKLRAGAPLAGNDYYLPVFDRVDSGTSYGDLDEQTSGDIDAAMLPSISIPCEIDINAQNLTYSAKAAVENYYATGNGWSNWGEHWMPLSTTNYSDYNGFLNLDTEFKFAPQEGWGGDFGTSAAVTETENNGVFSYSATLDRASDNIKIGHAGLYWAYLNATTWEMSLTETKTWGMTGDFNGWGSDVAMTPSADLYIWTGELTVEAGQGWKFRANSDWGVNLGGQADALWNNGDNIVLPEAGTYTITLDLTTYPATYTAVKK